MTADQPTPAETKVRRRLPERYRRARNLKEGMQVHVAVRETGDEEWRTITRVLHLLAPLKVTRIALDNGDEFPLRPDLDEVMSRG